MYIYIHVSAVDELYIAATAMAPTASSCSEILMAAFEQFCMCKSCPMLLLWVQGLVRQRGTTAGSKEFNKRSADQCETQNQVRP